MANYMANASLNDNFQELEKTVPEWDQETGVVHPKWLEHHQARHLTKDPGCPVCMEGRQQGQSPSKER